MLDRHGQSVAMDFMNMLQLNPVGTVGAAIIVTIIGATCLLAIVGHLQLKNEPQRLPPGPRGWPVVGNLPLLASAGSSNIHRLFTKLAKQYGPLVFLRLGSVPTVVVSSAAMSREFLKTHDAAFYHRPQYLAGAVYHNDHRSMLFASGAQFRHLRKVYARPDLLGPGSLTKDLSARAEEVSIVVRELLAEEGKVVDLTYKIACLATNNMTRMLMNKRYFGVDEEGKEEAHKFQSSMQEFLDWMGAFVISDYIPALRWVPKLQGTEASMERGNRRYKAFLRQLIEDHRASGRESEKDFIDTLLTIRNKEGTGPLDDDMIEVVIMELFTAGTDPLAIAITWAMAELIRSPEHLKRAQQEIDSVVGGTEQRIVEESDLDKFPFLEAVMKETLRMHPPTGFLFPHESREPCNVAGYNLPANTRVYINQLAIGRDENVWELPNEFKPERFLRSNQLHDPEGATQKLPPPKDGTPGDATVMEAFGSGRRMCPGYRVAIRMFHFTLARFLQSFDWSLPNDQDPTTLDMTDTTQFNLIKAEPLLVVPHARLPHHLY